MEGTAAVTTVLNCNYLMPIRTLAAWPRHHQVWYMCVCVCVCADLDPDAAGSVHRERLPLHPRQAKDSGDLGTSAQRNAHTGSQSTTGR